MERSRHKVLHIRQIETFYPEYLRSFKRYLLREYVQYKILETIFDSSFGNSISFMGGTALHIIYESPRFSEDLNFDNRGLSAEDFLRLTDYVSKKLRYLGCEVETSYSMKKAYSSQIKIKDILFSNGLSPHREEKLVVKVDMEPQKFAYLPENRMVNKFDVFMRIPVIPPDILAAQKICAVFLRSRAMGRDFYDLVYLLAMIKPNLEYIKDKLKIDTADELKSALLQRCSSLNFKELALDVEPFLYDPADSRRVLFFVDYIRDVDFQS